MIRFIDIGKQIAVDETDPEWPRQFAFWDTIYDVFLRFDGEQVWDDWKSFERAFIAQEPFTYDKELLNRCRVLCPQWVFTTA